MTQLAIGYSVSVVFFAWKISRAVPPSSAIEIATLVVISIIWPLFFIYALLSGRVHSKW